MSGGSFDYLYLKDAAQMCQAKEHLRNMAAELQDIGAGQAYRDTAHILALVEELERAVDDNPLMQVWHAIEWWKSCDWSLVEAAVVAAEYPRRREAWHDEADGSDALDGA